MGSSSLIALIAWDRVYEVANVSAPANLRSEIRIARSAPISIASLSVATKEGGPIEITVTCPLSFFFHMTAAANA